MVMHRSKRPCDSIAIVKTRDHRYGRISAFIAALLTYLCFTFSAHAATPMLSSTKSEYDAPPVQGDLTCPANGNEATKDCMVYGPMPPTKAGFKMPHKTSGFLVEGQTNYSTFENGNLNMWAPLTDKNGEYWTSPYSTGTPGNYSFKSAMIGDTEPCNGNSNSCSQSQRINGAYPQIEPIKQPTTREERACINRIKVGQASMQYIMSTAPKPFNYNEIKHIAWEEGIDAPATRMTPENHCQTYKKVLDPVSEYQPWCYIYTDYKKALMDPKFSINDIKECNSKTGTSMAGNLLHPAPQNKLLAYFFKNAQAAIPTSPFPESTLQTNLRTKPVFNESVLAEIKQNTNTNYDIAGSSSNYGQEKVSAVMHPFAPRYHYRTNERDWGSPKGAMYARFDKDNVACADVDAEPVRGSGSRKCGRVKVDIMEFRWDAFAPPMEHRIKANQGCYQNSGKYRNPCCLPVGFKCVPIPCWKCFGRSGQETRFPCSTSWTKEDLDMLVPTPYKQTKFYGNGRKLDCGESAPSLCEKLRAPVIMVNKLLLRRSDCDNMAKSRLDMNADGTCGASSEGMRFADYFSCRMPYMIQDDTGAPIRDMAGGPGNSQNPMDFAGQTAAIVGVGRAKYQGGGSSGATAWKQEDTSPNIYNRLTPISNAFASGVIGQPTGTGSNSKSDERLKYGGWGKETKCAGMEFKGPDSTGDVKADPATSWTEFLNYVATGVRKYNINCVMQYHKAFAPLDSVSKALSRCAGANFERQICSKKNENGASVAVDCDSENDGEEKMYVERRRTTWPASYRGQVPTAPQLAADRKLPLAQRTMFPYFGAKKEPKIITNLDDAYPGCLIIMPTGGVGDGKGPGGASSDKEDKPLMPAVGCIVSAHNNKTTMNSNSSPCTSDRNCNVIVATADFGQFPDMAGNTSFSGDMMNRTFYKPGMMPATAKQELMKVQGENQVDNPNTYCENPQFGQCEYEAWGNAIVYCPNDKEEIRDKEYYEGTPTS